MRHQLTQSSPLHFVCRDPKDSQYLDHNIDDYGPHSRSRGDASVYLKPAKETLNAVKEVNELGFASADIVSCLGVINVKMLCTGTTKDTDREENADPCKNYICRRECLKVNIRKGILHKKISRYSLAQRPGQAWRKTHTGHLRSG